MMKAVELLVGGCSVKQVAFSVGYQEAGRIRYAVPGDLRLNTQDLDFGAPAAPVTVRG